MAWTDSLPDLQDLERVFRGQVPGGSAARWQRVWKANHDDVVRCWHYANELDDLEEWRADAQEVKARLREQMNAGRTIAPTGREREFGDGLGSNELAEHASARAAAIAQHASTHPMVEAFRSKWLPDGVRLDDEEIRAWIELHAGGDAVRWVTTEGADEMAAVVPELARAWRGVVRKLVGLYGWDPGLAATFAAMGGIPYAPMLRVRTSFVRDSIPGTSIRVEPIAGTTKDKVTIEVHPDVPVGEVAAAYQRVLESYGRRRARLINGRVADAVVCSVAEPGGPAEQNAAMAQPYTDAGNYRRTVERAMVKLMGPTRQARDRSGVMADGRRRAAARRASIERGEIR